MPSPLPPALRRQLDRERATAHRFAAGWLGFWLAAAVIVALALGVLP